MPDTYPEKFEIVPLTKVPKTMVSVPGSKSITNRALVLAALSGNCTIFDALHSEDTAVMVQCLRALGFRVHVDWDAAIISVSRPSGCPLIPETTANLFTGNSGTTMRFLTALVALGHGTYRLDGVERMRQRPIGDLLDALQQLGVDARSEFDNGRPPVVVRANGLNGGAVSIRGDVSSQFLSGLLMVAPFATGDVRIEIEGSLVSEPYVEMTCGLMCLAGLKMEFFPGRSCFVPGNQRTLFFDEFRVEPDASAASYFWAAAAITGGTVTVADLSRKSLQGDVAFVDILAQMGCRVEECSSGITVHGRPLHGVDVDMNAISDTVMTLGAVACFADGPTTIRNVAHIRHKETDRIAALAAELRKVGATVEEFADGLTIKPGPLHGAEIDTYNDHRMAMSLALVGLKAPGVVILNPGCVAKTYPGFWADFERLR